MSINEDFEMALNRELYTLLSKHVQEFAKLEAHDLCSASHMARAFPSERWARFSSISDLNKITFWLAGIPRASTDCALSKSPSAAPLVHLRRKR